MILSAAACKTPHSAVIDPTEAPATEAPAATEFPTEAPTEEPTPEPTEEPTPELVSTLPPDAELGSTVLTLPVGNGKGEICFRTGVENVPWGPEAFLVRGGELYVLNSAGGNMLRFDMDGQLTGDVFICDPDPEFNCCPYRFAVGNDRLYIVDYNLGEIVVLDKGSGIFITSCRAPVERETFSGDMDAPGFWSGYNFPGSIIQMYEEDDDLLIVVHDTFFTIRTYLFDIEAGTLSVTEDRGLSGRPTGRIILHDNATGAEIGFMLSGWIMDKILGFDSSGTVYVSAFLGTADYQPIPRKVFSIGPDGSIAAQSAAIEDMGYIGFALGDDSDVYALIRDGGHVDLIRVDMY